MGLTKFLNETIDFEEDLVGKVTTHISDLATHLIGLGLMDARYREEIEDSEEIFAIYFNKFREGLDQMRDRVKTFRTDSRDTEENTREILPKIHALKGEVTAHAYADSAASNLEDMHKEMVADLRAIENDSLMQSVREVHTLLKQKFYS